MLAKRKINVHKVPKKKKVGKERLYTPQQQRKIAAQKKRAAKIARSRWPELIAEYNRMGDPEAFGKITQRLETQENEFHSGETHLTMRMSTKCQVYILNIYCSRYILNFFCMRSSILRFSLLFFIVSISFVNISSISSKVYGVLLGS